MRSSIDKQGRQGAAGFTLVELMVTIAVIAIIAAIAVPNFNDMLLASRMTAGANEISAAIQSARMDALRTNGRVELCPSTNGSTCGGSSWARFIVINRKSGAVVRDVNPNVTSLTVSGSPNVSSTNKIWFLADGFVRVGSATTPAQVGTLAVCSTRLSDQNARDVQVNVSRVSVARATRASCGAPAN